MRNAVSSKSRPMGVVEVVTALARLYPKTSAAIAFEAGVLVSTLVNAMRRRRGASGMLAKIVDVVPLPGMSQPQKRKARKASKPAKSRTKAKSRKPASKPAAETAVPRAEAA